MFIAMEGVLVHRKNSEATKCCGNKSSFMGFSRSIHATSFPHSTWQFPLFPLCIFFFSFFYLIFSTSLRDATWPHELWLEELISDARVTPHKSLREQNATSFACSLDPLQQAGWQIRKWLGGAFAHSSSLLASWDICSMLLRLAKRKSAEQVREVND